MSKIDTYQQVTDRMIAALENGTAPWRKGWNDAGAGFGGMPPLPRRSTGQFYRGINVLLLWGATMERDFRSDRWLTFKQAIELGGNVRKGEKGTQIVFFKKLDVTRQNDAGQDVELSIPMLRTYTVFNADQCDGLPERFAPAPIAIVGGKARDEAAEAALRSSGADIRETTDPRAFYSPGQDFVNMPQFDRFHSTGDYLCTLAHELCHWTGHKSRLDRKQLNQFGSKDYAAEELIAEIGAAFVGARLGIVGEHIDNHAAYVSHWLTAMKGDKRAIFRAASAAQTAADMVLKNAGEAYEIEPEELAEAA